MRPPRAISLFTGAGGLDYGFEAAGYRTAIAVEFDQQCCATLRHNRDWRIIEDDIYNVSTSKILDLADLNTYEPDVVIGGPPCQPFSKSGYWHSGDTKRLKDPRASTLDAYMRVVEEAQPRVFLLENVPGVAYIEKSEGLNFLLSLIENINTKTGSNYQPHWKVLKATSYGVPQQRERFFMVASREGSKFTFPEPTHGKGLLPEATAWDAIGSLPAVNTKMLQLKGKWADLLPSIPEGHNYLWHTNRGGGLPLFGWRRRYWSFLLKLAKDRPSWTIQAQPGPAIGPFHWDNRRLSPAELCRLQTFPDDIEILGDLASVQKQVGNAVPSLLAEVLARAISIQLLGHQPPRSGPRLVIPSLKPTKPPRAPTPVPDKFLHLAGDHEAHPGTGKGYNANS